jgi:hypothetical protein
MVAGMNRAGFGVFLALSLFLGFSACKRKQKGSELKASKVLAPRDTALKSQFADWPHPYWTAKAKVSVKMGGNSIPVNLSIRAEKGKKIWFSATALGIMEVARGLLDQDSVRIWDKINGKCYANASGSLGQMLPVQMDVVQLQHFFMGRVFWDSLSLPQKKMLNDTLQVGGAQGNVQYKAAIWQNFLLCTARAIVSDPNGEVQLENTQFKDVSGYQVAYKKQIQSRFTDAKGEASDHSLKWEFSKFNFVPESPDFSFSFPEDCQRTELK